METSEVLHKIESLAQLDTDAAQVYADVLEHVTDDEVREAFGRFRGEHRYHAEQLSETVVRLGGDKPELTVDLMGHVADWVSEFRSVLGKRGPLHAMKTAERYHNRRYSEAATWDVGDETLATMLRRFNQDEKGHLAFVEERLEQRAATAGGAQ